MINRIKVGVLLTLALLLNACASNLSRQSATPTADSGAVVLSFGTARPVDGGSHTLRIRKIDRSASTIAMYRDLDYTNSEVKFSEGSAKGNVQVMHLPEGEYEIFNAEVFFNGYPTTVTQKSDVDFSIRFSVKRGQVSYLGRYLANPITRMTWWGREATVGAYFTVLDRQERDLSLLRSSAAPGVSGAATNFVSSVPTVSTALVRRLPE
jgi:hypothetical protein